MGVEDEFEEMRKLIDRMLQDAVHGRAEASPSKERSRGPRPRVEHPEVPRRFLIPVPPDLLLPEPDVVEGEDQVYVTWEVRDVQPARVRTRLSGRLLLIELGGLRRIQRVVELPCAVGPCPMWTLRNGVLDLVLPRRGRPAGA